MFVIVGVCVLVLVCVCVYVCWRVGGLMYLHGCGCDLFGCVYAYVFICRYAGVLICQLCCSVGVFMLLL